jgi:hypothetical protein
VESLNFRSEVDWVGSWFFLHFVKNGFAEENAQIEGFLRARVRRNTGLILGQFRDGIFPVQGKLVLSGQVIQSFLDLLDFGPYGINIDIDILNEEIDLTLDKKS